MKIALFVPCYMDQLFPKAAMATLKLLEKLGMDVDFPQGQTCCGQPMANTGCTKDSATVAEHYIKTFKGYDYIVCPSGSCTAMVREHYHGLVKKEDADFKHVTSHTYELCEFLLDVLKIEKLDAKFPKKVGFHSACHGLRELRLGQSSERNLNDFSKPKQLLEMVEGLELTGLDRPDECCGFGGTFAVAEEAMSVAMGCDRVDDHLGNGAEVLTSTDMSCLMHMEGLIKRQQKNLKVQYIAEILLGED